MQSPRPPEPRDDVDRLFARMRSADPPPDLTARIMRALPAASPAPPRAANVPAPTTTRRTWGWVTAIAGIVLLLMSLRLGSLLDDSGALTVLGQIFSDFGGFLGAPGDYLAPLAAEMPWLDLIVALIALVVFWVGSSATVDQQRHSH